ncbi:hypothetical protein DFS34DRAFT_690219 [Phlyctochytrium arcticum]|nr:hypothetical protein DFS34DRAFT_690219 [Phlyctochytrium arcticum]
MSESTGVGIKIKSQTVDGFSKKNEVVCGICRKQFSVYTCPRCNLQYCSLNCYKSEEHAVCTESFYKDSLVAELHSQKMPEEERQKMLRILEKFERESVEREADSDDEDEPDVPDLADRLSGIDIDSASAEEILLAMTPEEREEFEKSIRENSIHIASTIPVWQPWWENSSPSKPLVRPANDEDDKSHTATLPSYTPVPAVPTNIKPLRQIMASKPKENVIFNIIDIILAYTFMARFLNGDMREDIIEAARIIWAGSRILSSDKPFAFSDVSEACATVKARLLQDQSLSAAPESIILAMKDTQRILTDRKWVMSAISDVHNIFESAYRASKGTAGKNDANPLVPQAMQRRLLATNRKVYFYLSLLQEEGGVGEMVSIMAAAMEMEAKLYESELATFEEGKAGVERFLAQPAPKKLVEEV